MSISIAGVPIHAGGHICTDDNGVPVIKPNNSQEYRERVIRSQNVEIKNNNDHEQLTLAKLFGVARYFN